VGTKTAGLVLVADVLRLDIGASLIFPIAETSFVNGYVPEGKGIIPDVIIPWDRKNLLEDRDAQLASALALLLDRSDADMALAQ
jgi:C-terminal processing protease CtpA/Prc